MFAAVLSKQYAKYSPFAHLLWYLIPYPVLFWVVFPSLMKLSDVVTDSDGLSPSFNVKTPHKCESADWGERVRYGGEPIERWRERAQPDLAPGGLI